MTSNRSLSVLTLALLLYSLILTQAAAAVRFEISLPDPADQLQLDKNEHLYLGIDYESDVPLRFLPSAQRLGEKREVGSRKSPADLHASGGGKALSWLAFDNPTHIDKVVITAYDEEWNQLATASINIDVSWSDTVSTSSREPAEWVQALQKKERVKRDYLFDSEPQQPDIASDTLLILSLLSIPVYIFLQIRMLRRYRLRWRELATVPLITALPLTMYALWVGIGFDLRLWPPFIMYFSLFASGYLLTLWMIKKIRE